MDAIEGTNGNDTFQAIQGAAADTTITTFDDIDGGDGRDTLNIVGAGGTAINANASISNIEVVNIATTAAVTGLNSASFQGVQELWQVGAAGGVTVGSGVTAGFRNVTPAAQIVTAADGVSSVSVGLDNVGTGSAVNIAETTGDDVTSVSVSGDVAGAGALVIDTATGTTSVDTINLALTSDGAVTLTADDAILADINASGSTGDLTLNLATDGVGEALESLSLGAGNDTVTVDNDDLDVEEVSISLGEGADSLNFDLATGAESSAVTISGDAGEDIFISDFDADEDAIDVSALLVGAGARVAQNIVNAAVNAADAENLFEAADAAFGTAQGGGANGDIVVFSYAGNTYIGADTDADGALSTGDGLIELTGVSVNDLTAANFVI